MTQPDTQRYDERAAAQKRQHEATTYEERAAAQKAKQDAETGSSK